VTHFVNVVSNDRVIYIYIYIIDVLNDRVIYIYY
jgi:hypothetical protein